MGLPTVTVLMSVLNGEPYLIEAIESVLGQTLADLELIAIDDGSTDASWRIISDFAERDSRVVPLRNETTRGTSRALNRGLEISRGRYVTRQDGDDSSMPERLAAQVRFLERNPSVGAVGTAVVMIDGSGNPLEVSSGPTGNREIQETLLDHMCFCGPTVMARRSTFERAGYHFDENLSYSEDYDLCLRLAEVAEMAGIETPLYRYRRHPQSVTFTQQYRQLFRKAMALEGAALRRAGSNAAAGARITAARDYVRAAVLGHADNDLEGARDCVARAVRLDPAALENESLVADTVSVVASRNTVEAALSLTEGLFSRVFPGTRRLSRLKARLIARLHMNEVFAGAEGNQPGRVHDHLWPGIRHDPTWLFNRGVVALLLKDWFRLRGESPTS